MTGEESHSEVFVSGHPAQEKEKKGAPVGLRTEPGTPATLLVPCPRAFKSPVEDPSGKNLGIGMVLFPLNNGPKGPCYILERILFILQIYASVKVKTQSMVIRTNLSNLSLGFHFRSELGAVWKVALHVS